MHSSPRGPKPLLGSHVDSVAFEPATTFTHRDIKDASVIDDFGDTKQLEFISQRSDSLFDHRQPGEHLLAGAGHNFTNTWDELDTPTFPPQLHVDSGPVHREGYSSVPGDHRTLEQAIESLLVDPRWLHNRPQKGFLPFNKLGELITRETVEKELMSHNISAADASKLSPKIVDISPPLTPHTGNYEKTTRRKLFAILVMTNKVPAIVDFIQENILDKDLPFVYPPTPRKSHSRSAKALLPPLCRKCVPPGGGGASMVPVESMQSWSRMHIEYFHDKQWSMLAPFLQLSNPDAPKVHHYPLDYHSILPFVELEGPDDALDGLMEMQEFKGGFSVVHKIQIHEHHHNLFDPTAPERERNPYFAVKILREGTSKEAFEQEVNCLKRLMEENNPGLVRLLGTLNHNNHYHLIFPWADANLEEFMAREYPNPDSPPRDASLARWVSEQLSSLASGLKLVHSSRIRNDNKQEMQPVSKKIYGRHGDIKPANILFFRSRDPRSGGCWSLGIFKICDFGFTEFHTLESIEVPAHAVGRSPTHKAPECDGISVSPSSDLWSLGAVMLELMAWYIYGWEGYNAFNQRRRDDDTEIMFDQLPQDKYFNTTAPGVAEVKQSVQKEMDEIRSHKRCSAFIHDVVDFIGNHLLVVDPQHRADAHKLLEAMEAINKRCLDSEDYCSSPIVDSQHPACHTTDETGSLPGSDGDMTSKTSSLSQYSIFTHQATVTRETTGLKDSLDEVERIPGMPSQEPYPFADVPRTFAEPSVPAALANQEPTSPRIARQTSGRSSKDYIGGLSRKNSRESTGQGNTSARKQNTPKLGRQSPQKNGDRQAGSTGVPGAPRWTLRGRDVPSSASAGTCSQEARVPPPVNTRKRKALDENILCPVLEKIPRRSTA